MITPASINSLREEHLTGLEEALRHGGGTHDLSHVLGSLARGSSVLFIDGGHAIVAEVVDSPHHRTLHFWLATGGLAGLRALSERVIEWGASHGCTMATLTGRPGWVRALRDDGWSHHQVVMGRRIDGQG